MKTFTEIILRIGSRYGITHVFPDFLEMVVCALSLGAMEDRYHEISSRYKTREIQEFSEALASLVFEMDDHGSGMKDCLGDFFMENISHGHNGQFFTPQPICELMALLTGTTGVGERVADCACGSGRTLMAAAKISRMNSFYGADIDRTCCLMAVINFCLNGMIGEVAWMDSLSNRFYGGWQIDSHPVKSVPYIREISQDESALYLRIPEEKTEHKQEPVKLLLKTTEVQPTLWDHWSF